MLIAEHISTRFLIEDLFSQSTYVRTYVHGGSRSGMSHGMLIHTGIGHMCVTQSDTFSTQIDGRTTVFFSDGNGGQGQRGHRGLDTTNTKQLLGLPQT